jgi:hypothetical protein
VASAADVDRTGGPRIALVGEARGEFLFLQKVTAAIEAHGGQPPLHFEMDPSDCSAEELEGVTVPALEPEWAVAQAVSDGDLAELVRSAEARYGIPNLRRLWRGDLQAWRDGVLEEQLVRQALGYLAVYDRVLGEAGGVAGVYFEDSTRLAKRALRAVALTRGVRSVVAIPFAIPRRVVLVDHETLEGSFEPWEGFDPTDDELSRARELIRDVRSSEVQFAEPRDLALTPQRLVNFGRMVHRTYRGGAGQRKPELLWYSARDYARQRTRRGTFRVTASRDLSEPAVFFPLHYANDSQVTIRGEAYADQYALVELIANSLPYGYVLWIKPHPAFAGDVPLARLAAMRRRAPNIRLLDPSIHAHEVLRHARAVVTINSTTGFEALMFGVPLVTLGRSLYRVRGLTTDVADPAELPFALAQALDAVPPATDDVARLLAYLERTSYDASPMGYDLTHENAVRYASMLSTEFA